MSKNFKNITIGLLLSAFIGCQSNNPQVSKRLKPGEEEIKTTDQYTTDQVDKLLEKQQKNKIKKDKYEEKRRIAEVKRIEKEGDKEESKKEGKKKKKLNDGEFKFY